MISYTVTTQKTQGQYESTSTSSINQNWKIFDLGEGNEGAHATFTNLFGNLFFDNTLNEQGRSVGFTAHDGGTSFSDSTSQSLTAENFEFSYSNSQSASQSGTTNSNLAATQAGASAGAGNAPDDETPTQTQSQFETFTTLTPTTISVATTTKGTRLLPVNTTETRLDWKTLGTTTKFTEGTATLTIPTTTRELAEFTLGTRLTQEVPITVTTSTATATELLIDTENSDSEEWQTTWPPRDTATVFREFQNECVWIPTAAELDSAGPWALTAVAASHTTDVTASPFYSSAPLKVVNRSLATLPETPEDPETVTEIYTTSTIDGSITRTIWTTNSTSAFPLASRETIYPKSTTTTGEFTYTVFTENNPALTEPLTEIGTQFTKSAEVQDFGLTFQEFFEFSFLTTRHAGTWSETFATQYNGPSFETWEEDETTKTIFYTNITVNSAEGVTIRGTNVEQIQIRALSPCAVSHVENSFTQAWGLHGSEGPQPVGQIGFIGKLSASSTDFAEVLPGLSVPYPSTYSWTSGNSTISASLVGNAIRVTTNSGTTSDSSTYEFSGSESAHTEQRSGREFFTNLQGLPAFSFFAPHAATESIETRARPGELVSIVQDSLGDFTLETITNETTSAATISENAVVFPGEKSFYTTTAGMPFLTFSRNPMP